MLAATHSAQTNGRSIQVGRFWVTGLIAAAEHLGTLVWSTPEPTPLTDPDRRLLERAAVVASLLQLFNRNLGAAEARFRGELLDDLLSPSPGRHVSIRDRARRAGYQPSKPHTVLVAHIDLAHRSRLASAAADSAAARHGLSTTRDGEAILLLPSDSPAHIARQLARSLTMRLGTEVTIGAAGPADDPADLPTTFQEARACLRALLRLDRQGGSGTAADLGYAGLLLGEKTSAPDFVTRTLGPVIQQDEQRSSNLITTLDTYFATGQSLASSAKLLHLHPNTITQRLERIKRLLQVDWAANPDQALDLQLALRLHRILRPESAEPRPIP